MSAAAMLGARYGALAAVVLAAAAAPAAAQEPAGKPVRMIAGMAAVLTVYTRMPWIAFLWHNLIGAAVVVVVGMAISYTQRPDAPRTADVGRV